MKRLVLAGGGHAHLHVLKALARQRWPGVEVLLVSPHGRQIYSGMLPGWIAGHYALEACTAALSPLAQAARVRFVQDSVVSVDADRRIVHCAGAGEIAYDVLSIDTGAPVDCSCLAATGVPLLPIRPLENFVVAWSRQLEVFIRAGRGQVVAVGGGAAGIELALAVRYRLTRLLGEQRTQVSLVTGSSLLAGHGAHVAARVRRVLEGHQVAIVPGPAAGAPAGLQVADGRELAADCIIAATGGVPPGWLKTAGLARAEDGFIAVGAGQQSVSHPQVFAAGDVASRADAPHAKSGIYAVRTGPVLSTNLARALAGEPLLPYRPQQRSLYLLATGPKEAIMSWGGLSACGGWAWRWKDWIDRRFLRQYDLAYGERP